MTESDDFLTPSVDVPKPDKVEQEQAKKTAEALPQDSEVAKKNKRLKASILTRNFAPPTLGKPGLLGV
jgi:hypothetical protein